MAISGVVRVWHAGEGWGVIDSPATPGGCWAHFSSVLVAGYKVLTAGQAVTFTCEPTEQDGYSFGAIEVWPADQDPHRASPEFISPEGFRSRLTITFDEPEAPGHAARLDDPAPAKVITLCGSTTFEAEFAEVNQRLTLEGCVVISLGLFRLPELPDYDWTVDSSDLKGRIGRVHFHKIRLADEVYVVDPGGYVGESTRREIAYAESLGKPVRYLSRERSARRGDNPQE